MSRLGVYRCVVFRYCKDLTEEPKLLLFESGVRSTPFWRIILLLHYVCGCLFGWLNTKGNTLKKNKRSKEDDVLGVEAPCPLLEFLFAQLPNKNRKNIKAVLRDRQVSVDGRPVTQYNHPLKIGQQVRVSWEKKSLAALEHGVRIVHEDEDLIVIDKPAGLLTIATEKEKRKTAYAVLSGYIKQQDPKAKIFIVHRIDRETSGLLLFARSEKVKEVIQETWMSTITERVYAAVVEGRVEKEKGVVTSWLTESSAFTVYSSQKPGQGKEAITHFQTVRSTPSYSLLKLSLETGRKHQIRVHMQDIGHPIVGDKKYGSGNASLKRLALHAQVLAFVHPVTNLPCYFETPLPGKFYRLFDAG